MEKTERTKIEVLEVGESTNGIPSHLLLSIEVDVDGNKSTVDHPYFPHGSTKDRLEAGTTAANAILKSNPKSKADYQDLFETLRKTLSPLASKEGETLA